jgi:hypothetical protein
MKNEGAILAVIAVLLFLFTGCRWADSQAGAFLAKDQKYYDRIGITHETAVREDGMRSSGKEGTFEWWYFDSEFSDGTKIVVDFFTKNKLDMKGPAHPTAAMAIDLPDGRHISKEVSDERGTLIRASRDKCDVKVQNSYIRYREGGNYEVHFTVGDLTYDCLMKPKIAMWRPGTGHWYFGEKKDKYFAWFVALPSAEIKATLTMGKDVRNLKGFGYHDHNWGNEEMNKLMNHWYWSRVIFDDYSIIVCDIISEKKYGYTRLPVIMIAKNGKIIDDNEMATEIIRADTIQHPVTKKFMDNSLTFIQKTSDGTIFKINLKRKGDILVANLLESSDLSAVLILLAKLIGENPTYIRITGDAALTILDKGEEKTVMTGDIIWEQMFFGHNKKAVIHDYR